MPTVDFDMPADPNGRIAKAHVIWDSNTGEVTGIVLDDPGSGYDRAPQVVIRDGTLHSPINTRARLRADAARTQALEAIDAGLDPLAVVNPQLRLMPWPVPRSLLTASHGYLRLELYFHSDRYHFRCNRNR